MARISGQVINTAIFNDNIGGGQIHLYWRNPTTEERASYTNMSIQREGDELVVKKGEARQEYGLKILTGFRFGDFGQRVAAAVGGAENEKSFSHEPDHPDYLENWKDLVLESGADLVELLAARVFDMPCSIAAAQPVKKGKDASDIAGENKAQETLPTKNSQETLTQ
ncbi:MAG: hypothetical protein ABFS18_02165 [Thermodesulfobacteriota bacterium]